MLIKGSRLLRSDWLLGLAVTSAFCVLAFTGRLAPVEAVAYDLGARMAGSNAPDGDVIVVAIDEASVREIGPWPWRRDILAGMHARIASGQPRAVGYSLPLERPQHEHPRAVLEGLGDRHGEQLGETGREVLRRAIRELETDRELAAAFEQGPPVILGARFEAGRAANHEPAELPSVLRDGAFTLATVTDRGRPPDVLWPGRPQMADAVFPPLDRLAASASGVALGLPASADAASPATGFALAWRHGEHRLPSLPLALFAHGNGAGDTPPRIRPGTGIEAGGQVFPAGPHGLAYPRGLGSAPESDAVRRVSAVDVWQGDVAPEAFADRTVLVGTTTPLADSGAAGNGRPAVDELALQTAALLANDLFRVPEWSAWSRPTAFMLVALYLMLVLPRLRIATGLAVSALLVIALANAQFVTMMAEGVWLPLAAPLLALIIGHAVLAARYATVNVVEGFQAELSAANARLGEALRDEGRLDEAFRRLRRCRPDDEVLECIYGLGLDFERRRRFGQSVEVFEWLIRNRPGYRDSEQRLGRNRQRQEQAALGLTGVQTASQTLILPDDEVEKPMLGRYEIEREIGKGAMGIVYLGRDPRIGRAVAIKTLSLDGEFEGQSLDELRARFRREAETAGRLRHHNIVTIHDVGEDDGMAWIAMDYLEGTPISAFSEEDRLLPPAELLDVLAQVADALDHAHREGVVHRDVKPENILYHREQGTATVTDFGVASVSDHHKTRTGTILGTPSYMSPEQVAGRRVDGRSDMFSLGVTLYQLVTGVLPFTGDSLSSLTYSIANERHREVRRLRPDLPTCMTTITNRALAKDPEKRYTSAGQMATALRRCRERLAQAGDHA